jgi:hypothetical protein
VIAIREDKTGVIARVQVLQSFAERPEKISSQFDVRTWSKQREGHMSIVPVPQVGDRMICLLHRVEGILQHLAGGYCGFDWPVCQRLNPALYQSALIVANTMVEVAQTDSAEAKFDILKDIFLSDHESVARWAGKKLRTAQMVETPPDFFRSQIANESLTAGAKLELDWALLSLEGESWQHSKERECLFMALVTEKHPLGFADQVFRHIATVTQRPDIKGFRIESLVKLIRAGVENKLIPESEKTQVPVTLRWAFLHSYEPVDLLFQFAMDAVNYFNHFETLNDMLHLFKNFEDPPEDQRDTIANLVNLYQAKIDAIRSQPNP